MWYFQYKSHQIYHIKASLLQKGRHKSVTNSFFGVLVTLNILFISDLLLLCKKQFFWSDR